MLKVIHVPSEIEEKRGGSFVRQLPEIQWQFIDWTEDKELEADFLWCMYDPKDKNYQYNLANKYFTAVVNRIPVLVSEGTYMARRVRAHRSGFVIHYKFEYIKMFFEHMDILKGGLVYTDNPYEEMKSRCYKIIEGLR